MNEKKFRKEQGVFTAEGPKIINELLASPLIEPFGIYATEEWWTLNSAVKRTLPMALCYEINEQELGRISFLTTPNQVLGIFKQPVFGSIVPENNLTILLDGIQDPGNMGTIIRIADWFGIVQIVAGKDSADLFNPKVVQSTMGSIGRVNLVYEDLEVFIGSHKAIPLYASTLQGTPVASLGKIKEGMLLVGNESKGIGEALLQSAKHQVTIPKFGEAESLNAAVALGIILSHIVEV